MTALLYILPIFFILLAISAFFVNLDEPKGKYIFIGVTAILVITVIGNEVAVHLEVTQRQELEVKVQEVTDWKTGQIARMNTILASMSSDILTEKEKLANLAQLGWSSTNPFIQEAYAADEARKELLEFVPQAMNPAIIVNLPQSVDKMLVSFALEEMGFIVSAKQTQEKYLSGDSEKEKEPGNKVGAVEVEESDESEADDSSDEGTSDSNSDTTPEVNAIFFGHLVRNNDIKLVLFTLLRAGIQIKNVRVFRNKTNENARHIKFVYSKSYDKRTPYDLDKIKQTKVFKR